MKKDKLIKKKPFKSKLGFFIGSSTGMGRETAKLFVQIGGSVLMVARRQNILEEAAEEIKQYISNESQFVEILSCDATDMEKLRSLLEEFIKNHVVPDYLFNLVGRAIPGYIEEYTLDDFKENMNTNYYGQLVPTLIILPYLMKEKKGHIIYFSSILGYMGMMGYGAYVPTKFAIVGLAEALRNELKPHNIKVSIIYPPDTNTPGLSTEKEGKPPECVIMSETGGLLEPNEVAEYIINKVMENKFHISPGRAKSIRYINRIFPKLVRWFMDRDYRKAKKKVEKSKLKQ